MRSFKVSGTSQFPKPKPINSCIISFFKREKVNNSHEKYLTFIKLSPAKVNQNLSQIVPNCQY